jgi:hypothetical protein
MQIAVLIYLYQIRPPARTIVSYVLHALSCTA